MTISRQIRIEQAVARGLTPIEIADQEQVTLKEVINVMRLMDDIHAGKHDGKPRRES